MGSSDLTAQQQLFVTHFTSTQGAVGNAAAAARLAGYSERSAREIGRQLLDKPHVRHAVDEANRAMISGSLAAKAVNILERIMDDEASPLRVRLDAAKTILDRAGLLPPTVAERDAAMEYDAPLSQMSIEELELFIQRGQQSLARLEGAQPPLLGTD